MSIDNTKLERLKTLLNIANDGLSRADFELAFKSLIEFIKKAKEDLVLKIDAKTQTALDELTLLEKEFKQVIENAKAESDNTLAGFKRKTIETINALFIKSRVNEKLQIALNEVNFKIKQADDKMAGIKPLEPPDTDLIVKQVSREAITAVLSQLPPKDDFNEEISKAGDLIANTLENLSEEDKLKISAIKGLQDILDELKKIRTTRLFGGGGFSKSALEFHLIDDEVPTGAVNGVNTDFVLNHTPSPSTSLKVYLDGQKMKLTTDYTLSDKTITFLTAPLTNSLILCDYRR